MMVDRQDGAGSGVDGDGLGSAEVDLRPEFVEGGTAAVPPVFGRLLAPGTRGLGRRQFRGAYAQELAGGVDGDRADTGGAEVDSDEEAVYADLLRGSEVRGKDGAGLGG